MVRIESVTLSLRISLYVLLPMFFGYVAGSSMSRFWGMMGLLLGAVIGFLISTMTIRKMMDKG